MSEKCPECNSDLIELHIATYHHGTWVGSWDAKHYGYWCPINEKMYVKKHKEWLEPWEYISSNQTKIEGDEE